MAVYASSLDVCAMAGAAAAIVKVAAQTSMLRSIVSSPRIKPAHAGANEKPADEFRDHIAKQCEFVGEPTLVISLA
jgi:hypothetical protein